MNGMSSFQNVELVAEKRVKRGSDWLDDHAPLNWRRNLFESTLSGSHFRVRCLDNSCVLALAFETRAELASSTGYVTAGSVMRHFGLDDRFARCHGFNADAKLGISYDLLNVVWEETVRTASSGITPIRHPRPQQLEEKSGIAKTVSALIDKVMRETNTSLIKRSHAIRFRA